MPSFDQFLYELGNLHDCTVLGFEWRPLDKTMTFDIRDIHWNFEGMPEYKGPIPGKIILQGVHEPTIALSQVTGPFIISDFEAEQTQDDGSGTASIRFWHGGIIKAPYKQALFPDIP
jgi:hypothetical protein